MNKIYACRAFAVRDNGFLQTICDLSYNKSIFFLSILRLSNLKYFCRKMDLCFLQSRAMNENANSCRKDALKLCRTILSLSLVNCQPITLLSTVMLLRGRIVFNSWIVA